MKVVLVAVLTASAVVAQCTKDCTCSNCYDAAEISVYAPVGVRVPPDFVPYHVHADLVAAVSNLAERVSAIEARARRGAELRAAAKKRAAEKVSDRKRVNELNEILKKRYKGAK